MARKKTKKGRVKHKDWKTKIARTNRYKAQGMNITEAARKAGWSAASYSNYKRLAANQTKASDKPERRSDNEEVNGKYLEKLEETVVKLKKKNLALLKMLFEEDL